MKVLNLEEFSINHLQHPAKGGFHDLVNDKYSKVLCIILNYIDEFVHDTNLFNF
jgi:hypothetical protein